MGKRLNLIGEVYGRLTVSEEISKRGHHRRYLCGCICGEFVEVFQTSLISGDTKSCGCLAREVASKKTSEYNTTHGMCGSSTYNSYKNMKARCYSVKNTRYDRYGGRGITVCDRWLESFENFYVDMGDKPSPKHSIERINNDANYCPENCKWATQREQVSNTSSNNNGLPIGVRRTPNKKYSARVTKNRKTDHLGTFDTALEAATAYDDKCEEVGEGRPNGTTSNQKKIK